MILLQVKRRVHILPEKSRVLMPPCEELRVHIKSLDKKIHRPQLPVPEKSLSRPERNPKKNEEDPIKDPSTQMCSRSRQKSILPDARCPRIPRRMKKIQEQISPENLQQRSPVIRRRLSADKCRGTPMWKGQSSQVIPRPFCPRCGQTDILQGSGCGEDHGFPPGVRITHPRGLSVVSSSADCYGEKNV